MMSPHLEKFRGEVVVIHVKDMAQAVDQKGNVQSLSSGVTAYLLDYDHDFFYMGETPFDVNMAVAKDMIIYIAIPSAEDLTNTIIDEMGDERGEMQ